MIPDRAIPKITARLCVWPEGKEPLKNLLPLPVKGASADEIFARNSNFPMEISQALGDEDEELLESAAI